MSRWGAAIDVGANLLAISRSPHIDFKPLCTGDRTPGTLLRLDLEGASIPQKRLESILRGGVDKKPWLSGSVEWSVCYLALHGHGERESPTHSGSGHYCECWGAIHCYSIRKADPYSKLCHICGSRLRYTRCDVGTTWCLFLCFIVLCCQFWLWRATVYPFGRRFPGIFGPACIKQSRNCR